MQRADHILLPATRPRASRCIWAFAAVHDDARGDVPHSRGGPMRAFTYAFAAAAFTLTFSARAQTVLDFESGDLEPDWLVVDEKGANLGDAGPSTWEIRKSAIGLDGNAVYQGSNIWGDKADAMLMGTFLLYQGEEYIDFILDIDVAAADNDGMGLVWAYTGVDSHYRVNIINDGWPEVPIDGEKGPMVIMHKRISDDEPWYDLLEVQHPPDYDPYPEGVPMHWTLEVTQGQFKFTNDNGDAANEVVIEAEDTDYEGGFVGIQLYAQQSEFDNVTIVSTYPGDPNGKAATSWGALREAR